MPRPSALARPRTKPVSRLLPLSTLLLALSAWGQQPIVIDAHTPAPPPAPVRAALGTDKRPDGTTLTVNSQYLVLNGHPWLPVMGELHYSRVPRENWEAEILKMKAGGVQIISTYVIWLHQEEIEGQFDWSGQRDLRAFVALCAKHGMYVYPRIGPWAHGETRHGGLPDWVLAHGPTRQNDPIYLGEVTTLFNQIGAQLRGELWKDGGPVVGIQLENEYSGNGKPGSGSDHIRTLKEIARKAGLDVPLYTVTGWDGAAIPLDAVLPVYGGYPDAPWDGSPARLPPNEIYSFRAANRVAGNMGAIGGSGQNPASAYAGTPFLTAEVGGGMEDTYFRRPVVSADDIAAIPPVLVGSGANLLGFYMYQGGRNPEGRQTTLQESQVTGYPTDVPVKSYDFQAPLGEFGEERPSFRRLKLISYFLNSFGDLLAPMTPYFPAELPSSPADLAIPRVAARSSGSSAFLFLSNYLRGATMPERKHFAIELRLPSGPVVVPSQPIDLPSGAYGIWPVNLALAPDLQLRYSTAQLFHQFTVGADRYICFFTIPGVAPELALDTAAAPTTTTPRLTRRVQSGVTYLRLSQASDLEQAVYQTGPQRLHLLLFSRERAEQLWRVPGQAAPLVTAADFYADEHTATMQTVSNSQIEFSLLATQPSPTASAPLTISTSTPLLRTYTAHLARQNFSVDLHQLAPGFRRAPLQYGASLAWRKQPLPLAPDDAIFHDSAATWRLILPETHAPDLADVRLRIRYQGDVARLNASGKLLEDNFWNGEPWVLSLHDLGLAGGERQLELQVLPWPAAAPMYLETLPAPAAGRGDLPDTPAVELMPLYQVAVHLEP